MLGINAGGACGSVDFRTNGDVIYGQESDNYIEPKLYHMERFLNCFDTFEAEFYKYIDKCCEQKGE